MREKPPAPAPESAAAGIKCRITLTLPGRPEAKEEVLRAIRSAGGQLRGVCLEGGWGDVVQRTYSVLLADAPAIHRLTSRLAKLPGVRVVDRPGDEPPKTNRLRD